MTHKKKMVIVGEWNWPWYQEICAKYIKKEGWDVIKFGWHDYFRKNRDDLSDSEYISSYHRIEYNLQMGPISSYLNRKLINVVKRERPDALWLFNTLLITKKTIQKIKKKFPSTKLIQYSNDDPFSKDNKKFAWRHFIESIPFYDYHFCYRSKNLKDLKDLGAKDPKLFLPYFIPEEDFHLERENIEKKYICDVVFAGHYENDGRSNLLRSVINSGYKLNLFGGNWNNYLKNLDSDDSLKDYFPVYPAIGENYRKAICGSKVALCFHSKINNDTYTRRNFQIPSMKIPVLSEYSRDLDSFFIEDEEIVFFKNEKELISSLNKIIIDSEFRKKIAINGHNRVYKDNHDVNSRIKEFLNQI